MRGTTASRVLCSACRRRPAVYYRTYSGQPLCAVCLTRALEKALRRSIGLAGGVEARSAVAVPLAYSSPHYSLVLADIAARVESRFGTRVVLLRPRGIQVDSPASSPPGVEVVDVDVAPPDRCSSSCCWRFDTAWSAREAAALGATAVLLPMTLTDRIIVAVEELLEGCWCGAGGFEEGFIHSLGVKVIKAFASVEGEAVSAYAAIRGVRAWPPCRVHSPAKEVLYSVMRGRPELEYSASKTLRVVASQPACTRCSVCGWPSKSRICRHCARLAGSGESASSPRGSS